MKFLCFKSYLNQRMLPPWSSWIWIENEYPRFRECLGTHGILQGMYQGSSSWPTWVNNEWIMFCCIPEGGCHIWLDCNNLCFWTVGIPLSGSVLYVEVYFLTHRGAWNLSDMLSSPLWDDTNFPTSKRVDAVHLTHVMELDFAFSSVLFHSFRVLEQFSNSWREGNLQETGGMVF